MHNTYGQCCGCYWKSISCLFNIWPILIKSVSCVTFVDKSLLLFIRLNPIAALHLLLQHLTFGMLWAIVLPSLSLMFQRPPNDMKHSIEHIKGYRAQEQQNLRLVLLDKCRTELILKAKCWHTHWNGEAAGDAMIAFSPVKLPRNPWWIHWCFLMGSHLVIKNVWLSMLQWPDKETWNIPPASWGISFLELMIGFSQDSGRPFH